MLRTRLLLQALDDPDFEPVGPSDHPVLRYGQHDLVAAVYEEHVESVTQGEEDQTPPRILRWLRFLETSQPPNDRLFRPSPLLSQDFWDRHVKAVALRRSGTRITLPLDEDIPLCVEALQPFFLAWTHISDASCDLSMFPAVLLRATHRSLTSMSMPEFKKTIVRARKAVPGCSNARFAKPTPEDSWIKPVADWPGLRAYPPFYLDVSALQDPPAKRQQWGQWVAIHALGADGAFAKASPTTRGDAIEEDIVPTGKPWPEAHHHQQQQRRVALLAGQDAASDATIAACLKELNGWVPPGTEAAAAAAAGGVDWAGRVARAAQRLLPTYDAGLAALVPSGAAGGAVFLPERPFDRVEAGFQYTPPDEGSEEPFYAVAFGGTVYRLSSYVGFGLRLRMKVLGLGLHAGMGRGVCVVVPDKVEPGSARMHRVEAAARCWLRGLCDTVRGGCVVIPERACVGAALSRGADRGGVWVGVHDGPGRAVAQVWQVGGREPGLRVLHETPEAYQAFARQVYGHLLNAPEMDSALAALAETGLGPEEAMRTLVAALRSAMPVAVAQMGKLASGVAADIEVPLGEEHGAVTVRLARSVVMEWVCGALRGNLEALRPAAKDARGVLVSGILFERLPDLGALAVAQLLNLSPNIVRPLKTHGLRGALYHVYSAVQRHRFHVPKDQQ